MVRMAVMSVGLSASVKLDRILNASSNEKVLNVTAALSSFNNSCTDVGMEMMPPNVVRCVAEQTSLPSFGELSTPSELHSLMLSSQYLQLRNTEQFASMKPGGHKHKPSVQLPRPLQKLNSEQSPAPCTSLHKDSFTGGQRGRGGQEGGAEGGGRRATLSDPPPQTQQLL